MHRQLKLKTRSSEPISPRSKSLNDQQPIKAENIKTLQPTSKFHPRTEKRAAACVSTFARRGSIESPVHAALIYTYPYVQPYIRYVYARGPGYCRAEHDDIIGGRGAAADDISTHLLRSLALGVCMYMRGRCTSRALHVGRARAPGLCIILGTRAIVAADTHVCMYG